MKTRDEWLDIKEILRTLVGLDERTEAYRNIVECVIKEVDDAREALYWAMSGWSRSTNPNDHESRNCEACSEDYFMLEKEDKDTLALLPPYQQKAIEFYRRGDF